MIKVKQLILVEGKYDKIKLSSMIDGLILQTDGFAIFKDKQKMQLIRAIAKKRGVVILTDSDSAGFCIRSYIGGSIPPENVIHAYIPDIMGKEKRKDAPSKEGKLGVEGMSEAVIRQSLSRAGVLLETEEESTGREITQMDLYEDGLSGKRDSKEFRHAFLAYLDLPQRLSTNSLLQILNVMMTYDAYQEAVAAVKQEIEQL